MDCFSKHCSSFRRMFACFEQKALEEIIFASQEFSAKPLSNALTKSAMFLTWDSAHQVVAPMTKIDIEISSSLKCVVERKAKLMLLAPIAITYF